MTSESLMISDDHDTNRDLPLSRFSGPAAAGVPRPAARRQRRGGEVRIQVDSESRVGVLSDLKGVRQRSGLARSLQRRGGPTGRFRGSAAAAVAPGILNRATPGPGSG
jgi:hypothetical protein